MFPCRPSSPNPGHSAHPRTPVCSSGAVFNRRLPHPGGREPRGALWMGGRRGELRPPFREAALQLGRSLGHLRFVPTHGAVEARQSEFFRHQASVCGAPKCHKGAAWARFLSPESEEGEADPWGPGPCLFFLFGFCGGGDFDFPCQPQIPACAVHARGLGAAGEGRPTLPWG